MLDGCKISSHAIIPYAREVKAKISSHHVLFLMYVSKFWGKALKRMFYMIEGGIPRGRAKFL